MIKIKSINTGAKMTLMTTAYTANTDHWRE